ncbi:hypothetical protein B5S27_g866 [[Candida] boidinii]|nr:hypothetical protein B5S27_g866 [[Candida] boidinii]
MQFRKLALLAGVAATAFAADSTSSLAASLTSTTSVSIASGCSFSDTFTATAQADLDELASCQAIRGDISISGELGSASIANVKVIYGDLSITNATDLSAFYADSLSAITGALSMNGLTILSTLSFGSLTSVGSINWTALPALTQTGFTKGITDCLNIVISDTGLESLQGLDATNVEIFNINNNKYISTIDSGLQTVSNGLIISYNAEEVEVTLDNLIWANNITFSDVSSISMSNLTNVNSSLGFIENQVESLDFPTLTNVGESFSIVDNDELTETNFKNLEKVGGGFVIANNSKLASVENFDKLTSIGGGVILTGEFQNATLPSLRTVRGAFDLESTEDVDCDAFDTLESKAAIGGSYACTGSTSSSSVSSSTNTRSSSSGTSTSSGSSDSTSSSSSRAAASNFGVEAFSIFGTLAAIALSLL